MAKVITNTKKRIIIIGLDGVPYRLIDNLCKNKVTPEIKTLIEKGVFRQIESSIPEISSVAWSAIITGKNPGKHGIFGYTCVHNRNQNGAGGDSLLHLGHLHHAEVVHRQIGDLMPAFLQVSADFQHRWMFYSASNDVISFVPVGPRDPDYDLIV